MQAERVFSFDDKSNGDSIEVRIPEVINKYFVFGLPFTLCIQKKKNWRSVTKLISVIMQLLYMTLYAPPLEWHITSAYNNPGDVC